MVSDNLISCSTDMQGINGTAGADGFDGIPGGDGVRGPKGKMVQPTFSLLH